MSDTASPLEELFTELGRFLVAANSLEHELFELYVSVSGVARDDALNQCSGETLGRLLTRLLAAYRRRIFDTGLLASLDGLEKSLWHSVDRRNEFVHASYSHDGDSTRLSRYRRPMREKGQQQALEEFQRMQPSHVFGETHALWQVIDRLMMLRDDTLTHLGLPGWWST